MASTSDDKCPICLRTYENEFTREDILEEMQNALEKYNESDIYGKFLSEREKFENIDAKVILKIDALISSALAGIDLLDIESKWPPLKLKLEQIYNTLPIFIGKELKLAFASRLDDFIDLKFQEEIIKKRMAEVDGSSLLQNFNDLRKKFKLDFLKEVNASFDSATGALKIKMKEDIKLSVEDYHIRSSSEGEKSILSLLFFFAYAKTVSEDKELILVFDDPIDSHDNYNKHFILDLIMKNVNELNAMTIIFTHSSDITRTIKLNYRYSSEFFMMTRESKNLIFKINKSDLTIFDGPFNFYRTVFARKGNNMYLDMVALIPLFRDVVEHAKTLNFEIDEQDTLAQLYKELSNNYLHFNVDGNYKTLEDLFKIYKRHLKDFPYSDNDLLSGKEKGINYANKTIVQYIIERRRHRRPNVTNLVERIKFKNILAIYIRRIIEKTIFNAAISKLRYTRTRDRFKREFKTWHTISIKQNKIRNNYFQFMSDLEKALMNDFFGEIDKYKHITNDYHHQINSYITPMLEMSLDRMVQLAAHIDNIEERYSSTKIK